MVLWKTIDKHVIHYQEHIKHMLYLKCLHQASWGSSPMPAYKKRKLMAITNLGSWIKSKGLKKMKTEDCNMENVDHNVILLIADSSTSSRWIHKLPMYSLLYGAKQLPYST